MDAVVNLGFELGGRALGMFWMMAQQEVEDEECQRLRKTCAFKGDDNVIHGWKMWAFR